MLRGQLDTGLPEDEARESNPRTRYIASGRGAAAREQGRVYRAFAAVEPEEAEAAETKFQQRRQGLNPLMPKTWRTSAPRPACRQHRGEAEPQSGAVAVRTQARSRNFARASPTVRSKTEGRTTASDEAMVAEMVAGAYTELK